MTRPLRAITFTLSLLALLAIAGCSTGLKLAYDNLERLALWEIDDYVDLDDPQKALFRKEFKALHIWHRQSQLPLYAADLRSLAAAIDTGAPLGSAATTTLSQADGHGERLWEQAKPGVERLLATLGDGQIADYDVKQRRKFAEEAAERADEALDDRRKRWLREWRNSMKRWLGTLNAQQTALLEAGWNAQIAHLREPAERAAVRLASHQRFIAGLSTGRKEPGLIARFTREADAAEKALGDAAQARERALIATLFDAADAQQRRRLKATLLELAGDFDALAARGASVPAAAP